MIINTINIKIAYIERKQSSFSMCLTIQGKGAKVGILFYNLEALDKFTKYSKVYFFRMI